MQIGIYDEAEKTCLYTADVSFSTDTVLVLSCDGMGEQEMEDFLMSRAVCPEGYGADSEMAKRLRLTGREHEFGHMQEARVLYAMLHHFRMPGDGIAVFPLKNELVSMIGTDCRYSNLYTWRHI